MDQGVVTPDIHGAHAGYIKAEEGPSNDRNSGDKVDVADHETHIGGYEIELR
jgi:hypothetical protein